jgi:hypothetical protein
VKFPAVESRSSGTEKPDRKNGESGASAILFVTLFAALSKFRQDPKHSMSACSTCNLDDVKIAHDTRPIVRPGCRPYVLQPNYCCRLACACVSWLMAQGCCAVHLPKPASDRQANRTGGPGRPQSALRSTTSWQMSKAQDGPVGAR